ncbi:MAG: hypothetical protein LBI39_03075 [Puniceicoccales bacterium]|jgi:hypothetical protein|nr:hypothetical protein [Puniceicoccales bacterium]
MGPLEGTLSNAELELFSAGCDAIMEGVNSENSMHRHSKIKNELIHSGGREILCTAIATYLRIKGPTLKMRIAFLKTLNYGSVRAIFFALNHPRDELFEQIAHKIHDISRKIC